MSVPLEFGGIDKGLAGVGGGGGVGVAVGAGGGGSVGGVRRGVGFAVGAGEVVMRVGENGAGKSTLKNILSGLVAPDAGEIRFRGESFAALTTADADRLGIGTIHQELSLFGNLSVAE